MCQYEISVVCQCQCTITTIYGEQRKTGSTLHRVFFPARAKHYGWGYTHGQHSRGLTLCIVLLLQMLCSCWAHFEECVHVRNLCGSGPAVKALRQLRLWGLQMDLAEGLETGLALSPPSLPSLHHGWRYTQFMCGLFGRRALTVSS